MRGAWALLLLAGCTVEPTPDEAALERYEEADRLFAAGRYAEAAPLYESVIAVRDRVKGAYFRLADCRERLGDPAGAAEALERLLRIDRHDGEALRRLERLKGTGK